MIVKAPVALKGRKTAPEVVRVRGKMSSAQTNVAAVLAIILAKIG